MLWVSNYWRKLKIHSKILFFSLSITAVVLVTLVTDAWMSKVMLLDLREQLQMSEGVGDLVEAMEKEADLFTLAIREDNRENEEFLASMEHSRDAIDHLPLNYQKQGAESYALTRAIIEAYEVYEERRDAFLIMRENQEGYLTELYTIYDMQDYLNSYASELLIATSKAGNEIYQMLLPQMVVVPVTILILSIVMIIGVIELTRAMNQSFVEPISKLAEASKRIAENDYTGADIETENEDEISDLVHAFNKMKYATGKYIDALEERRETLELLHEEEMQKIAVENQLEQTKFEVLRNQMNPHFLFNTLNVIGGMANLENADLTESMIKALSNLFRYNLRTTETEIALERDIQVLEDYLYLQKMRFGERIKWEIHYDPEIRNYLVPTFMFQPFVENAIGHGISKKVEGGRIFININKVDEKLIISVRDNGVGMTEEALEALHERLSDRKEIHRGIGVGNIYRRLSHMYEESDLRIESTYGEGTEIIVTIPAREYIT